MDVMDVTSMGMTNMIMIMVLLWGGTMGWCHVTHTQHHISLVSQISDGVARLGISREHDAAFIAINTVCKRIEIWFNMLSWGCRNLPRITEENAPWTDIFSKYIRRLAG